MLNARMYYDTVTAPLLDGSLSLAAGSCGRLSRRMRRGGAAAGRHARMGSCSLFLTAKRTTRLQETSWAAEKNDMQVDLC
jgi:hypothetical protein